ncbi:putative PurR-regulated permease PerM [Bradyrhizobium sp. USDA 3397]|uniref:AI-2E family transporter n=1 Tax=Bradyrhizobium yuanmingense TaxID=108015 RepID=UPI0023029E64|nr:MULTISPECIES: AI-2E family transporter [Bradyrhizobium]MDA9546403.1 permease [Bradyrhizobium sp. CCBAU 45321]MDF0581284.1 AI-2E family transporter [Bradyrhizobium yuanmingense]
MKTLRQLLSAEDIVQLVIRLGLLGLLIFWTFVVLRPFVPILSWSAVLAVAFHPVFAWLAQRLGGRPRTASAVLTLITLGIVIGPAAWLGLSAVEGIRDLAGQIGSGDLALQAAPEQIRSWPLIGPQLYAIWNEAYTNIRAALREVAPYLKPLAGVMLSFAGDTGIGMLQFLLSVIVAGFLLPHGAQLVAALRGFLLRVVPGRSEHFLELAGATIRAVAQGIIGVAILQALLAGIGFKLAEIPSAGLLAVVVLLLSIVQIGAGPVLFPVLVWIWVDKDVTVALLLTVYLVVVGLLDNVLKPLLMGRGLTTPTLVILIGVIGGTLAHGIIGLFIGPIILSVAWELATAWTGIDRAASARVDQETVVAKETIEARLA